MRDDFFDLPIEQRDIVLISKRAIARIELRITACEGCDPEAEIPLGWILDKITDTMGQPPTVDVNQNEYTQTSVASRLEALETLQSAFVN